MIQCQAQQIQKTGNTGHMVQIKHRRAAKTCRLTQSNYAAFNGKKRWLHFLRLKTLKPTWAGHHGTVSWLWGWVRLPALPLCWPAEGTSNTTPTPPGTAPSLRLQAGRRSPALPQQGLTFQPSAPSPLLEVISPPKPWQILSEISASLVFILSKLSFVDVLDMK